MKPVAIALSLLIFFAGAVAPAWQAGNRGAWTTLAPVPSIRQEISTAVLDGKIYVIAGFNSSGGNTNTVEVYDPQTNTWSSAANRWTVRATSTPGVPTKAPTRA